jgi:phage terminase small subunit
MKDRHKRAIDEYFHDFDAVAACRRAGYRGRWVGNLASRLFARPEVVEELAKQRAIRSRATGINADRIIREVARIALADPRQLFDDSGCLLPIHSIDDDTAAAVASIEIEELFEGVGENRVLKGYTKKIKLHPKTAALEQLCKYLGLIGYDLNDLPIAFARVISQIRERLESEAGARAGTSEPTLIPDSCRQC